MIPQKNARNRKAQLNLLDGPENIAAPIWVCDVAVVRTFGDVTSI